MIGSQIIAANPRDKKARLSKFHSSTKLYSVSSNHVSTCAPFSSIVLTIDKTPRQDSHAPFSFSTYVTNPVKFFLIQAQSRFEHMLETSKIPLVPSSDLLSNSLTHIRNSSTKSKRSHQCSLPWNPASVTVNRCI